MSTLQDVLTFARTQTQTNANGISDTAGIVFANEALVDFHRRLVNTSIDASQIQEAYRDGAVPPTGNGSTFLYPTDMLFLKTIEINRTSSSPQDYLKAEQVDQSNLQGSTSFSWLRVNGNANQPKFADNGDWYEIFPAFTSADNLGQAIRLIYFQKPTEFTSTSDTVSYPSSLDYRILGWRIAADYLYSIGATTGSGRNVHLLGDTFNNKYDERVKQLIATLGRGSQQPIQASVPDVGSNGWQF